jgi:hypothetical protein
VSEAGFDTESAQVDYLHVRLKQRLDDEWDVRIPLPACPSYANFRELELGLTRWAG